MTDLTHWNLADTFYSWEVGALMLGKEPSDKYAEYSGNPIYKALQSKSDRSMELLYRHAEAFYKVIPIASKIDDFLPTIGIDYKIEYARDDITPSFIKYELDLMVDRRVQQDDKWITSTLFWKVWNEMRNTLHIDTVMQPKIFGGEVTKGFEILNKEFCSASKFSREEIIRWIRDNNLSSKYDFSLGNNPDVNDTLKLSHLPRSMFKKRGVKVSHC